MSRVGTHSFLLAIVVGVAAGIALGQMLADALL